MKRIAVIGSRDYPDFGFVREQIGRLPLGFYCVVSGAARGVDRIAADEAKRRKLACEEYPADWEGPLGKGAGFARNETMADLCDGCWAFWDGKSRGTLDMVRRVRSKGKPVVLWGPNRERYDPDTLTPRTSPGTDPSEAA